MRSRLMTEAANSPMDVDMNRNSINNNNNNNSNNNNNKSNSNSSNSLYNTYRSSESLRCRSADSAPNSSTVNGDALHLPCTDNSIHTGNHTGGINAKQRRIDNSDVGTHAVGTSSAVGSSSAIATLDEVGDLSLLDNNRTWLPKIPPAIIPFLSPAYMLQTSIPATNNSTPVTIQSGNNIYYPASSVTGDAQRTGAAVQTGTLLSTPIVRPWDRHLLAAGDHLTALLNNNATTATDPVNSATAAAAAIGTAAAVGRGGGTRGTPGASSCSRVVTIPPGGATGSPANNYGPHTTGAQLRTGAHMYSGGGAGVGYDSSSASAAPVSTGGVGGSTITTPESALQVVLYRDRHVVLCNRNTGALRARMLSSQQQTALETVRLVQCPLCAQPVNPRLWSFEAQSYFNLLQEFYLAQLREKRRTTFSDASAHGGTTSAAADSKARGAGSGGAAGGRAHSRRHRSSSAEAAFNFMTHNGRGYDDDDNDATSDDDVCDVGSPMDSTGGMTSRQKRSRRGRVRPKRVTANPFSPLVLGDPLCSTYASTTTYAGGSDVRKPSSIHGHQYGQRIRLLLESDHRLQLESGSRRGVPASDETSILGHAPVGANILSSDFIPPTRSIAQALLVTGYYSSFFTEVQKLGSGSFGQVYLCHHVLDDLVLGEYAVKKVPVGDDRLRLKEMSREVKIREKLHHPNIVEYKHSWLEMHRSSPMCLYVPWLFVLMEHCNGGDLEGLFWDDQGTAYRIVPEQVIWKLFVDILQGLHHIHHSGILHRDMKLSNILLHHSTDELTHQPIAKALLADFGTAQKFTESMSSSSLGKSATVEGRCGFTGTVEYTAPELLTTDESGSFSGGYDIKSDMWSFGVVLYALAFGVTPFKTAADNWDPKQIMSAVLAAPDVIPFPSVPARSSNLCLLIQALLAKDPVHRPSTDDLLYHPTLKELFTSPSALSEASALLAQFMRCRR